MTANPGPSLASLLARFPLFQPFPADQVEALAAGGDFLNLALGERVFRRGDRGQHLYLLVRGRVRFSRGQPTGERKTLAVCGPGELLGDEVLTAPGVYAATCSAAESTRLWRLPCERMLDLVGSCPEVDFRLPALVRLHRLLQRLGDDKFEGLSGPREFTLLHGALRAGQVKPGSRLAAVGVTGEAWFYLRAGTVRRTAPDEPARDLGPGECFATEALLGLPSRADITAVTDLDCLWLPRREHERLSLSPELAVEQSRGLEFTWVGQRGAVDCSAAALCMAARCLGRRIPIEDIYKHLVLGERGADLDGLTRAAAGIGLAPQAIQAGPEALAAGPLPAVALLAAEHYVVVYEWGPASVRLGDPARGVVVLPQEEFLRQWSGHLLLLRAAG